MVDFELSEEQIALREKARKFALEEIIPVSSKYDKSGEFPLPIYKKAFKAGLMNLGIPKQYGGQGYGSFESVLVVEEIAAADPGIATSMYANDLGAEPIILAGTEEQKRRFLTPLTKELKFISFATSEPGMGSDVAGIKATYERQGDEYILNGNKFWITNGNFASYYVIFARLKGTKRHEGLSAFVVPRESEGLSTGKPLDKLGHRASDTGAVILKNVRVPAENRLGEEGVGFLLAMGTFMRTRPAIGAFATGLARSAMEYAINYAKQREAFEHKISSFQAIQHMVADMYARIEAMRLLTWKAAWLVDRGDRDANTAASVAKLVGSEDAMKIAIDALQVYGGRGYLENYRIAKLFRDAKLFQIYEGTSQIQRYVISRYLFKEYEPIMKGF
ncbi:MAG: acyl-CoA dehydrogenase family protein [Candidatus Freyarchaeota archaeon]|nr:acyl-CoA dehydrogenase family protein [Candidatus Jordarchaeia archaeon]MBS7281379.1 acyl-CoA dehydrogenase family protein [Candidatus Jordarchaeia archaeon]